MYTRLIALGAFSLVLGGCGGGGGSSDMIQEPEQSGDVLGDGGQGGGDPSGGGGTPGDTPPGGGQPPIVIINPVPVNPIDEAQRRFTAAEDLGREVQAPGMLDISFVPTTGTASFEGVGGLGLGTETLLGDLNISVKLARSPPSPDVEGFLNNWQAENGDRYTGSLSILGSIDRAGATGGADLMSGVVAGRIETPGGESTFFKGDFGANFTGDGSIQGIVAEYEGDLMELSATGTTTVIGTGGGKFFGLSR